MNTSNPLDGERRCGSVGLPLPGVTVRVVGERARRAHPAKSAASRSRARTCSRATGACRRRRARSSPPTASSGPATSARSPPTATCKIVGRAKDLIITGGLNVYPKEIEERIDALPGVVESAVIGVPDADFGEAVTAVVVAQAGPRAAARPTSSPRSSGNRRASRCPSACTSSTSCRATRWARSRRTLLRKRYSQPLAPPQPFSAFHRKNAATA